MTMQVSDRFMYKGRCFENPSYTYKQNMCLVHFEPNNYGLVVSEDQASNCWRGFVATFDIRETGLFVASLQIRLDGVPPPLDGVKATGHDRYGYTLYENLNLRTDHSGTILLAEVEWSITMNRFRNVYEFAFEKGALIRTLDCSAELIRLGRKPTPRYEKLPLPAPDDPPWLEELSKQYKCDLMSAIDPGYSPPEDRFPDFDPEKIAAYDAAVVAAQSELNAAEVTGGPDSSGVVPHLLKLADIHQDRYQYEKSEPCYARALAVVETVNGPDHPEVVELLRQFAVMYTLQGRYTKAEPLHQRALAITETAKGSDHPDVAEIIDRFAQMYSFESMNSLSAVRRDNELHKASLEKAEFLYSRALAIREKTFGPDHCEVASSLHNFAALYSNLRLYEKAEPYYQRALAINEKAYGRDHCDVASLLHSLAWLYTELEQYEKAEPLYKRALAIREKILGPDDSDTANSRRWLAELYSSTGREKEARELKKRAKT